jgi:hypothetical protein
VLGLQDESAKQKKFLLTRVMRSPATDIISTAILDLWYDGFQRCSSHVYRNFTILNPLLYFFARRITTAPSQRTSIYWLFISVAVSTLPSKTDSRYQTLGGNNFTHSLSLPVK